MCLPPLLMMAQPTIYPIFGPAVLTMSTSTVPPTRAMGVVAYADYPKTFSGAGWPINYEEVTPLCDALLVDIKFTANLDG
jgi:hypothetical protein